MRKLLLKSLAEAEVHLALPIFYCEELEILRKLLAMILRTIIEKFGGGPVGLNTIATSVSEDPGTIEEVYEPFLIQEGFLQRTPRGREATELAYKHIGKFPPSVQGRFF